MVVSSVRTGIISLVYDHSDITLESLLYLVDKALNGKKVKSMGIFSEGNSREINLLQGKTRWYWGGHFSLYRLNVCPF